MEGGLRRLRLRLHTYESVGVGRDVLSPAADAATRESSLRAILGENYELGEVQSLERIGSGVSNENYRISAQAGNFVVRIAHFEPENQIKVMLPFLEYAEAVDFPAPRLLHTRDGSRYAGPPSAPIIVTSIVPGIPGTYETISDAKLASLGAALAKLHQLPWQATASVTADAAYILGVYREFAPRFRGTGSETSLFCGVLEEEFRYFSAAGTQHLLNSLPTGLIHNDVIPPNVMFAGDSVTAFVDLEEVSQAVMLLDVSRVMNSWCFREGTFVPGRVKAFLTNYGEQRPLAAVEIRQLPLAMRFVSFRNSVYALRMLSQGRLSSPRESEDYAQLTYIRAHPDEVARLVADAL